MRLGELGVWYFTDAMTAKDAAAFAGRVEYWGYSALWIPETVGREPFAHAAWLLANTRELVVATGIANIYARDPFATVCAQKTLAEQSGGRFLLGLGVSHAPLVSGVRGHAYGRPVATMRAYLERMAAATYLSVPPPEPPPTVIAALGPRMLGLARECAQGAHPYLVTPEHTAGARQILGPEPMLCVEQKVLRQTDPAKARDVARRALGMYLGLPNYQANLRRMGFADSDIAAPGSDRLVDAIVAWGDEDAIRARIRAHLDAGASHVCIQPLNPAGVPAPDEELLAALAPGSAS